MNNEAIYNRHMAKANRALTSLNRIRCTLAELSYAASFLLNFILGKLLHIVSQQEEVYNYYNDKGNIFNQLFVKKGWGWTTFVVVLFYTVEMYRRPKGKVLAGAVVRYILATIWWIAFTQWFFGHPIMDKVFLMTGGKCANIAADRLHRLDVLMVSLFQELDGKFESRNVSSATCRRVRGTWEGGHDPLGHVFLLVHSSLYLFHEIKPYWPGWKMFIRQIQVNVRALTKSVVERVSGVIQTTPQVAVVALLLLWWFMLLMTNMYFHLLAEKLVGLLFGYAGVIAVYYVPRWVRAKQDVVERNEKEKLKGERR